MKTTPDSHVLSQKKIDDFVSQVGQRVRSARKSRGISRRLLSEQSGVSQRYLALLESGGGNISIALLYKVAAALSHELSWFLTGDERTGNFIEKYRRTDAGTRSEIDALLDHSDGVQQKHQRICLIGLRGAGKSTIGKMVGESLGSPFKELNGEIEILSGLSVSEVMDLYGVEGYRKLERQSVQKIIQSVGPVVIAAAGGVVSDPGTYQLLLDNFHTVWLKASAEEHMQRVVQQGDQRPMAGHPQAMGDLRSILADREERYALADTMIDTSNKTVRHTAKEVLAVVTSVL